jgi:hypothetical protein
MDTVDSKITSLLSERPWAVPDLRNILGVSATTLLRIVARHPEIISVGKARATMYAIPRNVRERGSHFPVYQITENGDVRRHGFLQALRGGGFWWAPASGKGIFYRHLPWFAQDLRPDGFVGRAFVHRLWQDLGLPERLSDWNDDHVLVALDRRGEDIVGDLLIGEESLSRYLALTRQTPMLRSQNEYPSLADLAMTGAPPGSSAGGEQPKFTVFVERDNSHYQMLVKFSPLTSTETGQRWSDLLICEHIALELLREIGIESAGTFIYQLSDRTFLEVVRFDRSGDFGRLPINSLGVIDDEFFGERDSWTAISSRLLESKLISAEDATTLKFLESFGDLIANTDRHFGNISLIPTNPERSKFRLAPAYDMLPIFYRPQNDSISTSEYRPAKALTAGNNAIDAARLFWERAMKDERISGSFRTVCRANLAEIERVAAGPRMLDK